MERTHENNNHFLVPFFLHCREVICKVAKTSIFEIREHMINLHYVTRLESVHIQQTPTEFAKSSKEGLVCEICEM